MKTKIDIIDTSISWEKSEPKKKIIKRLSDLVKNAVSINNYGKSIETILIGLIAVEPIYDQFSKPRRPRYIEHKETVIFGSIPAVFHKLLDIEIKMNYEQFLTADEEAFCRIVATEVLNTLHTLKLPKKVTDFDKDRFVADVESVFKAEHLID